MKRIVILCDGTWSHASSEYPTNVVHLGRALRPIGTDDVPQVMTYVPGVGTGQRGLTQMGKISDRILGGALGMGLTQNVVDAYTRLVFLYDPGDEIYIFGFSRGAYTARSLTGLIRSSGLLSRTRLSKLDRIVDRYRTRDDPRTKPDTDLSRRFRAKISPHLMTSPDDAEIYAEEGAHDAALLKIAYLGVWDTVGSLGVPNRFLISGLINRGNRFHDAELSRMVTSARHAVALDERRREFEPTLWSNLDRLNDGILGDARPYQERFFAGDHGAVGGGGNIEDLSSIALGWIIEGAERAGLQFDPIVRDRIVEKQNPVGPLYNMEKRKGGVAAQVMSMIGRDRDGPGSMDGVHAAVLDRYGYETKDGDWQLYRPPSLRRIEPDLREWLDARVVEEPQQRDVA